MPLIGLVHGLVSKVSILHKAMASLWISGPSSSVYINILVFFCNLEPQSESSIIMYHFSGCFSTVVWVLVKPPIYNMLNNACLYILRNVL